MIEFNLNEKYRVRSDNMNIILQIKTEPKDKDVKEKEPEDCWRNLYYYNNVCDMLKHILRIELFNLKKTIPNFEELMKEQIEIEKRIYEFGKSLKISELEKPFRGVK